MTSIARLIMGITLVTVPTIVYGGLTILGVVTARRAGMAPAHLELSALQQALYRAGHAHAGVLVILSLVLQLGADHAVLPDPLRWAARVAAPVAATLVSGGFFGLAHARSMRLVLYLGALLVCFATLAIGVGLIVPLPAAGG